MMDSLTGTTLGQYQVIEKIGEGGAAVIYRAFQASMQRQVAVKVLKLELAEQDPAFIERFTQEARAIAQLQHPHILPVIDFGRTAEFAYLVMVLLEGGTLRHLLREHGALPLDQCAFILAQVGSALERAHAQGIVHRDLKPENILMDADRNAYLTDFGIARILENSRRLTNTGMLLGTPHYLSPEQARGLEADTRADVYSLGVMLYEMVLGRLPFSADTPYGLLMQHISEPPPTPRSLNPDLPEAVEAVLLQALAKEPEDRFQTPLALAEAFVDAQPKAPTITGQAEARANIQPIGSASIDDPQAPTLMGRTSFTATPARLTPQRELDAENKIIITDNPDDPNTHTPMPNGYIHYALRALEEVAGIQATQIILRFAHLEDLLDNYPPNNMKFDRGYTFKNYADLTHSILNYYGTTGKEAIEHIGRLSARWMILDQPLFGFASAALRIMPTAAALRLSLNKTADGWRKIFGAGGVELDLHIIEKPEFFLWAGKPCPACTGKKSNAPICWNFEAGFIEGGMLVTNKLLPVKQIACHAMGDPYCVWRIDKKPREG